MKHVLFVAIAAIGLIATPCANLSAQIFDSQTFNGVMPDVTGAGDVHMHNSGASGTLETLVFSGFITEINTATFGSEIVFDYISGFQSGSNIQLTTTTGFTGTIGFEGIIDIASATVNAGDLWTYTFNETFDDGADGAADASVDITFDYYANDVSEQETNFGSFTLDKGFYARGGTGDADHPWTQVAFQVEADGFYSLESDWDGFDGYLYLFDSPFDGTDDSGNIAFDDDGDEGTADSRINTVFLNQGTTYYAMMTTFGAQAGNSSLTGDLRLFSNVGNSGFLAIPEPSTGFAIGILGLAFFARRRNRLAKR